MTQRGNHRERVFFSSDDYRAYLALIANSASMSETQVWAYCLMPNHVHFVMVPAHEDGLRLTFAEAHRKYTSRIHARRKVTGHLWQGRFSSTAMDDAHAFAAVRYVNLNPVRAGLVRRAVDWPWSSARAHLAGEDDGLVTVAPVLQMYEGLSGWLDESPDEAHVEAIRHSRTTGRPVGTAEWLAAMGTRTGRELTPRRRGPAPREFR